MSYIKQSPALGENHTAILDHHIAVTQLPHKSVTGQCTIAVIGYCQIHFKHIAFIIGVTRHLGKKHHLITPSPPLFWRYKTLVVHKGIKNAHKRGALSGIVLEVEQLESGHIGCAKVHLNVGTVKLNGPSARGTVEVKSLTAQPRSLKPALELGKIVGAQHSRVF